MAKSGQDIQVVGAQALGQFFRDLPQELRANTLTAATEDGAEVFEREARNTAPRGRSGELRRAIDRRKSRKLTDRHRVIWEVGVSLNTPSSRKRGFYGVMLERGTKVRTRKSGGSTGKAPALRWLRRAYERGKGRAAHNVERLVLRWVKGQHLPEVRARHGG